MTLFGQTTISFKTKTLAVTASVFLLFIRINHRWRR